MRIIARRTLREFWDANADAEGALKAWFSEARSATWQTPNELKGQYANASILKDGRVVFNICGNKYRLLVWINYAAQIVLIKFIGTHEDYDELDLEET